MRLRHVLSLFLVAAALPAHADPLSDQCGRLVGGEITRCLAAGNGRYIDPAAADQCGRLVGGQVTACMGAIAGKDYGPGAAGTCGSLVGGQVVDCFRRTGRPHAHPQPPGGGGPPPSMGEIRGEIAAAREQIRAGDAGGAEARLGRLLDRLR